ncbi:class I SAM-dependent methyltransferase [Clostridium carnis]
MEEQYYENLLNIKTCGDQKVFNESLHYNRYEPTSYFAFKNLFENIEIKNSDTIVDFGCGKGRLNFFANYFYDINVIGIEMNNYFYKEALNNKVQYLKKHKKINDKISFLNCFAENYKISPSDNKFYFFNPFSIQIFIKIIGNILDSLQSNEREIEIILYYPSDDYIYYLENNTAFEIKKEIKLDNLYNSDYRQKFLVYKLNYL